MSIFDRVFYRKIILRELHMPYAFLMPEKSSNSMSAALHASEPICQQA